MLCVLQQIGQMRDLHRIQPCQLAQDLVGRECAGRQRLMHGPAVRVELLLHVAQLVDDLLAVLHTRLAQIARCLELFQHLALVGVVTVQLQAGGPQAYGFQAPVHHLQGGHLLGDEQHFLAIGNRRRNHVRDGLGLARAWRALDDEVLASAHGFYGQ